jgi:hypothetical protein
MLRIATPFSDFVWDWASEGAGEVCAAANGDPAKSKATTVDVNVRMIRSG